MILLAHDNATSVLNDAPSNVVDAVDFHGLRHSFKKLQRASHKLDKEKVAAEKKFRKLLGKLPKPSSSALERFLQRLIRYALGKKDPVKQFIKAAKRVQRANAKLVAFEKGFISEEGIKDREWYRHLVIAPGKWLGECWLVFVWMEEAHQRNLYRVRCHSLAFDL